MKAALLVSLFCFFSIEVSAEMDAKTLLKTYDVAAPKDKEIVLFTISRTQNGMSWANSALRTQRKEDPLYCVPSNVVLTGEQIVDILRRHLKEDPSAEEVPYGLVMLLALQKTFPCNGAGIQGR